MAEPGAAFEPQPESGGAAAEEEEYGGGRSSSGDEYEPCCDDGIRDGSSWEPTRERTSTGSAAARIIASRMLLWR